MYCYSCGTQLKKTRKHYGHYDGTTGKLIFVDDWFCPKKQWFDLWHPIEISL